MRVLGLVIVVALAGCGRTKPAAAPLSNTEAQPAAEPDAGSAETLNRDKIDGRCMADPLAKGCS